MLMKNHYSGFVFILYVFVHYPRWSIISAEIEKNPRDKREESFRIQDESIQIIRKLGTDDNWQERKK